ncbi:hypothetical protein MDAP_000398 [Mitosporidium daphniae]
MFRYLVEIGNAVFGSKKDVFFRDLKVAYDQFQIASKKNLFNVVPKQIAHNRGIKAFFSEPNWEPLGLENHEKLPANETFYCELPHFEHEDDADHAYDAGKLTKFSNSILDFFKKEIAYKNCFMRNEIPLISYLDSLTFRIMPMVEKSKSSYLIFNSYKEIYIRYLKVSLNNDENKFKVIDENKFKIDLLERILQKLRKLICSLPEDREITSRFVSILFKDNSYPLSLDEMGKFFNVDIIKSKIHYASEYGYDRGHFKRMAYILTVIANPASIENSNNTVLPKTFLLDRHYYNLLHMLCKDKFSSIFYFLTYLQEDHAFILSESGMKILYTFIFKASTYAENGSEKALPLAIQYFLSSKDKLVAEIFTGKDDDIRNLRLLANYQIILNRLMSIQKRDLGIGDFEDVFMGEYESIFAFFKLNTLIFGEKFSNLFSSHDLYLSVISNFELIKSFFFKEEIEYVLRIYYDH